MTSTNSSPTDVALVAFDKNSQFDERFTVGVDLGQSHDPTAIAVVRRLDRWPAKPLFQVGHLSRLPLGTPYPAVVAHVTQMLSRPPLRGKVELCLDITGVGKPIYELFLGRGVSPIGVTITAGDATTNEGLIYRVPKLILISRIQALLHDGRLKIHKDLPDAQALVDELQDFRADVTRQRERSRWIRGICEALASGEPRPMPRINSIHFECESFPFARQSGDEPLHDQRSRGERKR